MNKKRILLLYKMYPFAIASYFRRALERRDDVELFVGGEFFGQTIPWGGGMQIPMKYPNTADLPLPQGTNKVSYKVIKDKLPWTPDLIINVDAMFHLTDKPDVPYVVVATDPHVLGGWYHEIRPLVDYFFNMQPFYLVGNDVLLPYAFDPTVHYPINTVTKEYDCSIVGLHYPQRNEWVQKLRNLDIKVNYRIGDIYDEYREENNKAWIGLNWSSLEDVTARVFEIMAMKMVPVLNKLWGLDALGFEDGRHYLGFTNMEEAVSKVQWAIANPDFAKQIALESYLKVHKENHTYDNRIQQIFDEVRI